MTSILSIVSNDHYHGLFCLLPNDILLRKRSPCILKFYSQSISSQLCWISSFTVNLHLSVHIPCHFLSFHDWSSQKNLSLLITGVGPRLQDLIINYSQLFTVWAVFIFFFKFKCFFFVSRVYCWLMWHVSLSG